MNPFDPAFTGSIRFTKPSSKPVKLQQPPHNIHARLGQPQACKTQRIKRGNSKV
jgi:hypothetical protein